MSNEQAVTELRAAKEVLYERGWAKTTLVDPDTGAVCLLGACGVVGGLEETMRLGSYAYIDQLPSVQALAARAPERKIIEASVWTVNDEAESFDEICDFIDATIKDLES